MTKNQEYKEPHKWEQWELEVMKRLPERYKAIYAVCDSALIEIDEQQHILVASPIILHIEFDTLKDGEKYYIDEELKRNGMSR